MKNKADAKAKKPQVKIRDMKPRKEIRGGLGGIAGESQDDKHKETIHIGG
jgi:hypothetical protein